MFYKIFLHNSNTRSGSGVTETGDYFRNKNEKGLSNQFHISEMEINGEIRKIFTHFTGMGRSVNVSCINNK